MSKNMSSTNERYEAAAKKFNEAYDKYAGTSGLTTATNYANKQAEEQAQQQSKRAGETAAATANKSARTAGLSKAQSALLGEKAAADTTNETYNNVYNNTRNSSLSSALSNNQATMNSAATNMSAAQTEGQNAYNRSWGNLGGVGSMVTGLLTSDARLKDAKDVSSDSRIDNFFKKSEKLNKPYELLKVNYKKEDK